MTYTLYYVAQDIDEAGIPMPTWTVRSEQYADFADTDPIEGSDKWVSGNHPTMEDANTKARALQRRSYSTNRKDR